MQSNPTTPTIAELWRKFQLSCKDVAFYRQLNGTLQSIEAKKIAAAEANFTAIRAQLIERKEPSLPVCVDENGVGHADQYRMSDYHREMSAYHGYKAWEIEQLQ